MVKTSAMIVSGGRGTRMGSEVNKVFLKLGDISIIERTLIAFINHPIINEIVIVHHQDDEGQIETLLETLPATKSIKLMVGGKTRLASVSNGLRGVSSDVDYVLVHDAVRPLVTADLIARVVENLISYKVVIPAIQVADTIKRVADGMVTETLVRDELVAVQTPQGFRRKVIERMYQECQSEDRAFTDDASLAECLGIDVNVIPGEINNIKMTRPLDLVIGEAILNEKGAKT